MINQLFLFLSAGSIMTLALSSSLHDMTVRDCEVFQVQSACSYLDQKK